MFSLSPAVLAQYRAQAELAFSDYVHLYDVTITRDVYGTESVSSGLLNTYPCYIGKLTGKDEEHVERLMTAGVVKEKTALCLLPHNAEYNIDTVAVVSGIAGEWDIIWSNDNLTDKFKLYTKIIIMKKESNTNYKDKIGKNKI